MSVSKTTGLNSHPPVDVAPNGKHTGPGSRPPVSMKSRSSSGTLARDGRVSRDSTQDFADFIRGTGPHGASGPPSRVRAGSVAHARNSSPPVASPRTSRSAGGSVARARLQARDATVTSNNASSELIDFIRRGPEDSTGNNPRIPRHVAPFRSTMDSDQMLMSGATGGRAVDAILPNIRDSRTSTNVTETSAPSSMNSQSALLSKANKSAAYSAHNFDDGDMMPKRTQRRVRDPYAIDLSDEDEELDILPKPKHKKEESLIDFLNNYEPPPEPEPRPIIAPQALPKKKSAPNLIARLRSGGSSGGSFSGLGRRASNIESRSLYSRASTVRSSHTPITVNIPSGADTFGSSFAAPSPRLGPSGRVPMKKFEPRDAVSSTTRTSDLASFLRDSEPPPSTLASSPMSPADEKTSGGFSRMFERRKKSSVF